MLSIDKTTVHTIVIQKSKFICKLIPIQNIESVKTELKNIRQEFPNATHYCYAYILKNEQRCSDDKEPSGTAGMPILNVLEKKELNDILAIVVRYFGGIKLGAGGLVRAYSNVVIETIKKSNLITLIPGKEVIYTFPYSHEKQIIYLLQNAMIKHKTYREVITYQVYLSDTLYEQLQDSLIKLGTIQIRQELLIPNATFHS